jgi:segregation and condensation protein B
MSSEDEIDSDPELRSQSTRTEISSLVAELGGAGTGAGEGKAPRKKGSRKKVHPQTQNEAASGAFVQSQDVVAEDAEAPAEGEKSEDKTADRLALLEASGKVIDRLPIDSDDDLSDVEGEVSLELVSVIESLLFAAPRALKVRDLRRVMPDVETHELQLALKYLIHERQAQGIVVMQMAGGFVLTTNRGNAEWVQTLLQAKPTRLSRPQLECLSVVAYKQPVTRPEIEHVRGVDCGAALKGLLERELVQVVGRADEPGRPLLYGTTVHFLEFFSLMSLRDLPDLREFKEITASTMDVLRAKVGDEEAEVLGSELLAQANADSNESGDSNVQGAPDLDATSLESTDAAAVVEIEVEGSSLLIEDENGAAPSEAERVLLESAESSVLDDLMSHDIELAVPQAKGAATGAAEDESPGET